MSSNENPASIDPANRPRRGSVTSQALTSLFARSNSSAGPTAPFPGPTTPAAASEQRRRMSISTLGLSGTSPTQGASFVFGGRRGSVSTANSDSIDENAIDDEEGPSRSVPTTPFVRRMSFGAQALRSVRTNPGGSPGANGRNPSYTTTPNPSSLPSIPSARSMRGGSDGSVTPPKTSSSSSQASTQSKPRTASDYPVSARPGESGGFNWSEQLRSRAESSVSQSQSQRPSFSTSPSAIKAPQMPVHERARSVSDMPAPPVAVPPPAPVRPVRKQPDAFQERILKGDFYMD